MQRHQLSINGMKRLVIDSAGMDQFLSRLDMLLTHVDINHIYSDGDTILHMLCKSTNLNVFNMTKEVLSRDISMGFSTHGYTPSICITNTAGYTPLGCAIQHKSFGICKILLDNGANPNSVDPEGRTPLHYAQVLSEHSVDFMELLLRYEAMPGAIYIGGNTILHHAIIGPGLTPDQKLVSPGLNVLQSLMATELDTSFHLICPNEKQVELLLEGKADISAINFTDATPLHIAARSNNSGVVTRIVNQCSNEVQATALVNMRNTLGGSPLHNACREGIPEVVKSLINFGSMINATTLNGDTPLHQAVFHNKTDNITILIEHGADITIQNNKKFTASSQKMLPATKKHLKEAIRNRYHSE
jgi:ankyrin repeat protein